MESTTFSARGLKLELKETAEETVVHCKGRITVRSAETFQSEICGRAIPESRGKGVALACRIVLDLSNVSYVDNSGLAALFAIWQAGQSRSCQVEIVNLGSSARGLAAAGWRTLSRRLRFARSAGRSILRRPGIPRR